MPELSTNVIALGGILFLLFVLYVFFQRHISRLIQEKALYQERANRLSTIEDILLKKEEELRLLGEKNAELRMALQRSEKETQEKLKLLEDIQKKWEDKFKVISSEALSLSNKSFLELAKETLGKFQEASQNDLTTRQKAIAELVAPVKESLNIVDKKIL